MITANADDLPPVRGAGPVTVTVGPPAIGTVRGTALAWPADVSSVTRTWAAAWGAESTSWVEPPELAGLPATTPCSCTGAEAAVKAPGAPFGPPETPIEAVTGTLDEIWMAAGIPPIEGSDTSMADPPGRSIPLPPVG